MVTPLRIEIKIVFHLRVNNKFSLTITRYKFERKTHKYNENMFYNIEYICSFRHYEFIFTSTAFICMNNTLKLIIIYRSKK